MWSGGFEFGDLWAAYRGPAGENVAHAHVAVQVAIVGDGPPRIALADGEITGAMLIVGPLLTHRLVPESRSLGLLYLAPQAPLAAALLASIHPARAAAAPAALVDAVRGTSPPHWAARLTAATGAGAPVLDARLAAALQTAAIDPAPGAVARAAVAVGLSEPRLRAITRQQLGAPLSQWLLWRKLEQAARAMAAGASLAAAAVDGGFADQAHFARTMKRMFGVTPAVAASVLR